MCCVTDVLANKNVTTLFLFYKITLNSEIGLQERILCTPTLWSSVVIMRIFSVPSFGATVKMSRMRVLYCWKLLSCFLCAYGVGELESSQHLAWLVSTVPEFAGQNLSALDDSVRKRKWWHIRSQNHQHWEWGAFKEVGERGREGNFSKGKPSGAQGPLSTRPHPGLQEQAEVVLSALCPQRADYRSSGQDADLPRIKESLRMAKCASVPHIFPNSTLMFRECSG